MSLSKSLSRSLSRSLSTGLTGDGFDPDFLAYRTLASSLVSEPFDLTGTDGYDSDFSAGVDGWGTADATNTGNIDSIGGLNDWMRVTIGSGVATTHLVSKNLITVGKDYDIETQVYIPSSNTLVDGIGIRVGGADSPEITTPTPDTVVTVSRTSASALGTFVELRAADGGTTVFTGNGTDVFYIRNVSIRNTAYASFTTSETEAIQNARFVGYKGSVPSRWSNAAVYGTAPTPVDVWNNNLTEVYGLSMVKFAGTLAKLKVASGGTSTLTNNNFVAGDYDPLSGLTGNGSSKYLDTGLLDTSLSADDKSFGAFRTSAPTGTTEWDIAVNGGSGAIWGTRSGSGSVADIQTFSPNADAGITFTPTSTDGFTIASRRGVNDVEAYKDGTSAGTDTLTASATNAAYSYFLFALNNSGAGAINHSDATLAFAHIGTGMSDAAAEWLTWVESCVAVDGGYNTFDPTVRWP